MVFVCIGNLKNCLCHCILDDGISLLLLTQRTTVDCQNSIVCGLEDVDGFFAMQLSDWGGGG